MSTRNPSSSDSNSDSNDSRHASSAATIDKSAPTTYRRHNTPRAPTTNSKSRTLPSLSTGTAASNAKGSALLTPLNAQHTRFDITPLLSSKYSSQSRLAKRRSSSTCRNIRNRTRPSHSGHTVTPRTNCPPTKRSIGLSSRLLIAKTIAHHNRKRPPPQQLPPANATHSPSARDPQDPYFKHKTKFKMEISKPKSATEQPRIPQITNTDKQTAPTSPFQSKPQPRTTKNETTMVSLAKPLRSDPITPFLSVSVAYTRLSVTTSAKSRHSPALQSSRSLLRKSP